MKIIFASLAEPKSKEICLLFARYAAGTLKSKTRIKAFARFA
ncbi:MAG: hypothetical protein WC578_03100 [Candidatus Omnitrophota bacterium]